jgi:hypothetical protein
MTVGIGRRHTPCPSATTGMLPHFEISPQVNLVGFLITSGDYCQKRTPVRVVFILTTNPAPLGCLVVQRLGKCTDFGCRGSPWAE